MFPHPWGFVGDMYKVSCEVIALQHKKKKRNQAEQDLKIWREIHFFLSQLIKTLHKKKLEKKYGLFYFKYAFGITFQTREGVKLKLCAWVQLAQLAHFQFEHF